MKFNPLYVVGLIVLTAILSTAAHVRANDDPDTAVEDHPLRIEKRFTIVAQAGGKHWIGVYAVPVDEALKSHLGIEDRLIVQQVIADSPAKKAGIQDHDVLLKYGDTSITTVEDLIKSVGQAEDKETSLSLIRGGKKMSLNVTDEKRPENRLGLDINMVDFGDLRMEVLALIDDWIHGPGANNQSGSPLRFRVVGPGVIDRKIDFFGLQKALISGKAKIPKNLSIQINKTGDTTTKIKVTLDGETWEVTEENLDKLPEEVRPHVKRLLGGHAGVAIRFAPGGAIEALRLKTLQVHARDQGIHGVIPQAIFQQKGSSPTARAIQILRKSVDSDVDVEQLRKDVKDLKAAVKKLQAGRPKKSDN